MEARAPIVVFDLDGTLVDTAADLIASLNHALASRGLDAVELAAMRPYAGHGGRAMIERVHAARRIGLKPDALEAMIAAFLAHYGEAIPGLSLPFSGTIEALDRLSGEGYRLAICTNKPQGLADRLVAALGLTPRFAAICGADAFTFRKPDPRHLLETIALAGGDPNRAIMVGDSRTDIDTAKAAGIPVVAVDFGYSDIDIRDLAPSRIISHYDELTPAFAAALIAAARG